MIPKATASSSAFFRRWTSSAWVTVAPAGKRRRFPFSRNSMKYLPSGKALQSRCPLAFLGIDRNTQ
jgi:hypothetical protein